MGTGWRRAFCTSIRGDPDTTSSAERQHSSSPRSCGKLGIFGGSSNPSTPRLQSQEPAASTPRLRCRTKPPVTAASQDSPKLQCKTPPNPAAASAASTPTGRSPGLRLFQTASNPSSPRSPSRFALLRNSLRLSRGSSCGICLQSVKAGRGTAIFTAECSHAFHFPCLAAHVRKQGCLTCPVCGATWRHVPLLSAHHHQQPPRAEEKDDDVEAPHQQQQLFGTAGEDSPMKPSKIAAAVAAATEHKSRSKKGERGKGGDSMPGADGSGRVYNDDEPLLSPRFNPIPEADDEQQQEEEDDKDDGGEFRGFFAVDSPPPSSSSSSLRTTAEHHNHHDDHRHLSRGAAAAGGGVQIAVLPDVALLSAGRSHITYVVALKVKAPRPSPPPAGGNGGTSTPAMPLLDPSRRAPIDLVTVLDMSGTMAGPKLHMLKRAMRLVIASLGPADRLSIVAFSASAKRLLPLRRMSPEGQRTGRRIVDRLAVGHGTCAGDALRKATKVLEERRDRNPVASIMLLSDGQQQQQKHQKEDRRHQASSLHSSSGWRRSSPPVPNMSSSTVTTRFAHLEIPAHGWGFFGDGPRQQQKNGRDPAEDAFARCVGGLLSVVLQDVRLQLVFPWGGEVSAVYSCGGSPLALGGERGSFCLGDLYVEEERDLLVELRMPSAAAATAGRGGASQDNHVMSVRCSYKDPALCECREQAILLRLPPLAADGHHHSPGLGSPSPAKVERLRNLFVTTRAVAEARRLAGHEDFATAVHLLSSARTLLLHSSSSSADEDLHTVEAELAELHWLQHQVREGGRRRSDRREATTTPVAVSDEGSAGESLTPTSAWRAAERLAKVAIMRKSLNRVSDLHGLENARF